MAENTKIEWATHTWNPLAGCTIKSPGCKNCYAMRMAHRLQSMPQTAEKYAGTVHVVNGNPVWTGRINLIDSDLEKPLRWAKPRMIFVNSMSDLFHEDVPFEYIDRVFAVMALCPQHTFQVLTKRADRMQEYMSDPDRHPTILDIWVRKARKRANTKTPTWPLPNVWLGVSAENQVQADERGWHLAHTPAAVRFFSIEPLLNFTKVFWEVLCHECAWFGSWDDCATDDGDVCPACASTVLMERMKLLQNFIHWVIVGGESGPGARPCDIAWIREIVKECREAGVACFVKQLGAVPLQQELPKGSSIAECRAADLEWPVGTHSGNRTGDKQYNGRQVLLKDPKGGDMSEWPEDLRIREFPKP